MCVCVCVFPFDSGTSVHKTITSQKLSSTYVYHTVSEHYKYCILFLRFLLSMSLFSSRTLTVLSTKERERDRQNAELLNFKAGDI
jgi:hypothetical protein